MISAFSKKNKKTSCVQIRYQRKKCFKIAFSLGCLLSAGLLGVVEAEADDAARSPAQLVHVVVVRRRRPRSHLIRVRLELDHEREALTWE